MRRLKSSIVLFAALTLSFSQQLRAQIDPDYKIGVILPLSGPMEPYGKDVMRGIQVALADFKEEQAALAPRVSLVVHDDQGLIKTTEEGMQDLVQKKRVHVVLGPLLGVNSVKAAELAEQLKKPLIIPAAAAPEFSKKYEMVFRSCLLDRSQGEILAEFAVNNLRRKNVAVLKEQGNAYAESIAQAFSQRIEKLGGSVLDTQMYAAGTTEFRTQLESLQRQNPSVVLLPAGAKDAGEILKQARALGFKTSFMGTDTWDAPELMEIAGKEAYRDNYFVTHFSTLDPNTKLQKFVKSFQQQNQEEPSAFAAMGYDAARVALDAFQRVQDNKTPLILKAIKETNDAGTLLGKFAFDASGQVNKPGVILVTTSNGPQFMARIRPE